MRTNRTASSFAVSLIVAAAAIATVVAQTTTTPKPASTTTTTTSSTTSTTGSSTTSGDKNVQQTLQEILDEPTGGEVYHYDPQGRRDPFQSLIGPAPKLDKSGRPEGVPGFLIDEMKLQGVVKTRQGLLVAMVGGPDNKGYIIRVGDKTLDGEVIRITPSSVIFRQEVNDPTRIERFREVVKELTPVAQKK
jgi:Tfp pilus assembly protein PilP